MGVQIDFDSSDFPPGTFGEVRVWAWAWDNANPPPAHGTPFFLYEGDRLVGTGQVI